MNYQRHYEALIERARKRPALEGYKEAHHVIPKCLGGTNDATNLVDLTAEEHFVAHQLLAKMHPSNTKVLYGAVLMAATPRLGRVGNKLYGWLRKRLAMAQSLKFKGRVWSPEQNAARSERVKAQWADPRVREVRSAAIKASFSGRKPVAPEKMQALKEFRSEYSKARWQDPEYRATQSAKNRARKMTEAQRAACSERMKGKKASDSAREKMRASRLAYIATQRAEGA